MTEALIKNLTEFGLEKHRDFLLGIARPCVNIIATDSPITKGCSRFNGAPDVPIGFQWPQHKRGPYRFIGQINLGEIPTGQHGLPSSGLLSFFYQHDENGESFWGDPDYVRVYKFDTVKSLTSVEPPSIVRFGAALALKFQLGAALPPFPWWDESVVQKWPITESQSDSYWQLRCRLHPTLRYLMGYPFNTTLGYDPTPGPNWLSLLTLGSDKELEWCWHDGDWLVTFIEDQRLRAGDFSQIKSDAG